jgi:alpha-glucosidase
LTNYTWWQQGIVYQIYPRSFQDSNDDGVGDIPGIISRLDYLVWLGVTAVWVAPIYPSPMADFGYDISDYQNIDPVFGRLADFDRLVAEAHARGLRVILDLVPNHTSDQHPWFRDSRASRTNPKRAWYIWKDPAPGGGPPNNWLSEFGGSAWTLDQTTGQYYYHAYLAQQPDLNWREPSVQHALYEVMRFWLDRGVDGFRVDAIHMLIEDESLRDNPENPAWKPGMSPTRRLLRLHTCDQPETHLVIEQMRRALDEYPDRVLIGEAYLPIDRLMRYYGETRPEFHLPFNFHLLSTPWNAPAIAALIGQYEAALPTGGWPNWVLGNHDRSRLASRVGGVAQARLAAMLLLTLRGTPTIYNGDELGMRDVPIPPDRVQDPWEKNLPGLGLGRDPCRTPMQWTAAPGAGFTRATPWLPLSADRQEANVEVESEDNTSILSLYRDLILLRQLEPALTVGAYREIQVEGDLFVYERRQGQQRFVIALNFGSSAVPLHLRVSGAIAASTNPERPIGEHNIEESGRLTTTLGPFEGVLVRVA